MAREMKAGIALRETEDAPPKIPDVNRHHRSIRSFHHLLETRTKLFDPPCPRKFPFGINGHGIAGDKGLARGANRPHQRLRVIRRVDQNRPVEPEYRTAPFPVGENFARHDKPNTTLRNRLDNRRVHKCRMVHGQQHTAVFRKVLQPLDADIVENADKTCQEETERVNRQNRERPD